MRAYLSQQFRLELTICPEVSAPVSSPKLRSSDVALLPSPSSSTTARGPEITFLVPHMSVGAIMGVGGQVLRELEAEFGTHVSVHREDDRDPSAPGIIMRRVTIDRGSKYRDQIDIEEKMRLCADKIRFLVEEHRERVVRR